jgi:hypothetical protein
MYKIKKIKEFISFFSCSGSAGGGRSRGQDRGQAGGHGSGLEQVLDLFRWEHWRFFTIV